MVNYSIEISRSAEKTLTKLPKDKLRKVISAIKVLAVNPRPAGCRKLSGQINVYRIRVGKFRIIYEVVEKKITIIVLKIGHRKDVYR